MAIKVGDKLPQATFRVMTADGPAAKTTDDLFKGRKIVLFAVPGAFTPTCHKNHLPGYLLMVALRSQGNWRWEGPLGTPRSLVHWKRASSPVEAGTSGFL